LLLVQKFDLEPLAGPIFQRLLNYCAPGVAPVACRPVGLVAETNAPAAVVLAGLGLQAQNLSGRLTNCDPVLYPVIAVAGTNACWQEAATQLANLTAYVQAGGRLLLHRPTDAFLAAAQPVLFPGLDPSSLVLGQVLRRDATNGAVRFYSHDLYWLSQAGTWNQPEVVSTNIARRTYRKHFNLGSYLSIQVASMPIHSTGSATSGGWWLYGNGYVAQNIAITQAGTYLFHLSASGTPAFGGWPLMTLHIDNQVCDSTFVPSTNLAFYTLSADLSAGTHQLSVSFDNDTWNPPTEDRNLFLSQIQWGRDADTNPAVLLTQPSAVAQYRLGSGLVVLDEIMWDSETQNATKAARYACTLMTGLGAAMSPPANLVLPSTTMTNVNVSAYSVSGNITWLNSNGRIQTPVKFTASGYYTFDVVAGGTTAAGLLPQVAVTLDGVNQTNFFVLTTNLAHYQVTLNITAGTHTVGLAFLNDYYANGQDRNAAFGPLTLIPQTAPRITALETDAAHQTATLQWEAAPGKRCEVQTLADFSTPSWRGVTNFVMTDNVATWRDAGDLTNAPPLSTAAPRRFYRVRQVGP